MKAKIVICPVCKEFVEYPKEVTAVSEAAKEFIEWMEGDKKGSGNKKYIALLNSVRALEKMESEK